MDKEVYLDHNATTPIHPKVAEALIPYLSGNFGNPSSQHRFGRIVRVRIDEARQQVADAINASPEEVFFTSGGSESDNFAIKGVAYANKKKGNHIITCKTEHPAVLATCKYLEKHGYEITYIPVDNDGIVNVEEIKAAIKDETILISIHHANNETGTILPIENISKIAKEKQVLFHTDAVQSFGKIPIDVTKLDVDLLTISSHKIYGPKGCGALYIRKGIKNIHPIIHGGHHENRKRGGTENVIGIIGFGVACEAAVIDLDHEAARLQQLRDTLYKNLLSDIPRIRLNGHIEKRLPNTLNMSFECVEGESLLINLDLAGIAISTGSACSSGSLEPSHVLVAMGIPLEVVHGSLRFSFGRMNTQDDVAFVSKTLPKIVEKVRAMSPLWDD